MPMIFTIVFTGIIRTFRTGADAKRAADAVRRGSSPSTRSATRPIGGTVARTAGGQPG